MEHKGANVNELGEEKIYNYIEEFFDDRLGRYSSVLKYSYFDGDAGAFNESIKYLFAKSIM